MPWPRSPLSAAERRERLQRRRRAGQADGRDLGARTRMPSQRRALEAPVAGALVEQHQRQRVLEGHPRQLQRRGGGQQRVARCQREPEPCVGAALRSHEHMFA